MDADMKWQCLFQACRQNQLPNRSDLPPSLLLDLIPTYLCKLPYSTVASYTHLTRVNSTFYRGGLQVAVGSFSSGGGQAACCHPPSPPHPHHSALHHCREPHSSKHGSAAGGFGVGGSSRKSNCWRSARFFFSLRDDLGT